MPTSTAALDPFHALHQPMDFTQVAPNARLAPTSQYLPQSANGLTGGAALLNQAGLTNQGVLHPPGQLDVSHLVSQGVLNPGLIHVTDSTSTINQNFSGILPQQNFALQQSYSSLPPSQSSLTLSQNSLPSSQSGLTLSQSSVLSNQNLVSNSSSVIPPHTLAKASSSLSDTTGLTSRQQTPVGHSSKSSHSRANSLSSSISSLLGGVTNPAPSSLNQSLASSVSHLQGIDTSMPPNQTIATPTNVHRLNPNLLSQNLNVSVHQSLVAESLAISTTMLTRTSTHSSSTGLLVSSLSAGQSGVTQSLPSQISSTQVSVGQTNLSQQLSVNQTSLGHSTSIQSSPVNQTILGPNNSILSSPNLLSRTSIQSSENLHSNSGIQSGLSSSSIDQTLDSIQSIIASQTAKLGPSPSSSSKQTVQELLQQSSKKDNASVQGLLSSSTKTDQKVQSLQGMLQSSIAKQSVNTAPGLSPKSKHTTQTIQEILQNSAKHQQTNSVKQASIPTMGQTIQSVLQSNSLPISRAEGLDGVQWQPVQGHQLLSAAQTSSYYRTLNGFPTTVFNPNSLSSSSNVISLNQSAVLAPTTVKVNLDMSTPTLTPAPAPRVVALAHSSKSRSPAHSPSPPVVKSPGPQTLVAGLGSPSPQGLNPTITQTLVPAFQSSGAGS